MTDAIGLCEQARTVTPNSSAIESMIEKVEAVTPDMDDYGDEIGSYGLNACVAVLHTLKFLLTKDSSDIFWVGNALMDTIDFKIQENEDLSDEQMENHPLMQETQKYLLEQTQ